MMMLGGEPTMKAAAIGLLDETQTFIVGVRQRDIAPLFEVIEDPELHDAFPALLASTSLSCCVPERTRCG